MAKRTFLVSYAYVPDIVERRQPYRADHLAHLERARDEGRLVLAGATTDPVDGAVLIVEAEDAAEIHAWVATDPYTRVRLIRGVTVREITVAVKREAT